MVWTPAADKPALLGPCRYSRGSGKNVSHFIAFSMLLHNIIIGIGASHSPAMEKSKCNAGIGGLEHLIY